ncbi:MAG: glycosyltransferase [Bacteroidales bacterium]|nr:glycosyltransferase [Bacteroidales bacterium]
MKLSVVIVNYNVSAFLEQALAAALKAMRGIEGEIYVVDNHSVDNSVRMVKDKFPQVKLIENQKNVGFAKANNQAIRVSSGEYVLLLNPDTLVEEDTFAKCIAFMDATPDCGGLGVKMVDGRGRFLPESKRGIPYPKSSFYKLFGLSKLFPKSKKFGAYHATYIGEDETHEVEVLSGAFMMMRRKVLDQVGLLDEDYFMYGEDIDLSYRILKGGYKNYYFPQTRIIHYKGESTKKGSLNYVYVFYKAMQIFARKHFSANNAKVFNVAIDFAIWFRASLAALKRLVDRILLPLLDFLLIFAGLFALSKYWDHTVLYQRNSAFPDFYFYLVLPSYALAWQLTVWLCGGYRKPVSRKFLNRGVVLGTVAILLVYALLPETMRFSRAVVVMGAVWTLFAVNVLRLLLAKAGFLEIDSQRQGQRVAIVGSPQECERVLNMVQSMNPLWKSVSLVSTDSREGDGPLYIGHVADLEDLLTIYQVNEVIFCSRDIPADQIIGWMNRLQDRQLEFKIVPEDSLSLIGSNDIFTADDPYMLPLHSVYQQRSRRQKRAWDVVASLVLLLSLPISVWFVENRAGFVRNIFAVLRGAKSWVGVKVESTDAAHLLAPGVLHPADAYPGNVFSDEMIRHIEEIYLRSYSVQTDLTIMAKGFRKAGRWQ